eukprot:4633567-Pyramimonas_sp.AAC.2
MRRCWRSQLRKPLANIAQTRGLEPKRLRTRGLGRGGMSTAKPTLPMRGGMSTAKPTLPMTLGRRSTLDKTCSERNTVRRPTRGWRGSGAVTALT